jgi:hypothetical protein
MPKTRGTEEERAHSMLIRFASTETIGRISAGKRMLHEGP